MLHCAWEGEIILPIVKLASYPLETIVSINMLAYVAEVAEWDNRAHLCRIKGYAYTIFTALGLTRGEAELLALASVLHDIGKSLTPDVLLKQQGSYTTAEWQVMERHTLDGEKMLRAVTLPIFQAGSVIALNHHERWDGSGYPNHLVGENIPISCRVCAVADVFDALTTPRSYKNPIDTDEAFDLIRSASGTLFDPLVVQAFVTNRSEILAIKNSHSSEVVGD